MSPNDVFKALLSQYIAPPLKAHGFRKQGQTFGLRGDGVWGIINFQKSQWSNRDSLDFTINVAIWSDRLAALDLHGYAYAPAGIPNHVYCPWRRRIGDLMPDPYDRWWTIETPLASWDPVLNPQLIQEVTAAVNEHAVPLLLRVRSDRALLEEIRRDENPQMADLDIVALYSICRPRKEFERIARKALHQRHGSEFEPSFRRALKRLGYEEPSSPNRES